MRKYDLIIVGGGPAGIRAAEKASEYGIKRVALLERENCGGTCLNWGCIPTKYLLHQAELILQAKETEKFGVKVDLSHLDYGKIIENSRKTVSMLQKALELKFKQLGIDLIKGDFSFKGEKILVSESGDEIYGDNIIIATGSVPAVIEGLEVNNKDIINPRDALSISQKPERVVIAGSGAVGLELGWFWSVMGVEVIIVELKDEIYPGEDRDSVKVLERELRRRKIKVHTKSSVKSVSRSEGKINVTLAGTATETISCDKLLVAAGRVPDIRKLNLKSIGLSDYNIEVDSSFRTPLKWLYAVGDVLNTMKLAHLASYEAEQAVRSICKQEALSASFIPRCLYTKPEIASFGEEERGLNAKGISFSSVRVSYRYSGRAVAENKGEGIIKLLLSRENKKILGVSVAGHGASELIHSFLLIAEKMTFREVRNIIFAHPSFSELVFETFSSLD